jgi:hypothetical protein
MIEKIQTMVSKKNKNRNLLVIAIIIGILIYGGNQGWFNKTIVINQLASQTQPSSSSQSSGSSSSGQSNPAQQPPIPEENPIDEQSYGYPDGSNIAFLQGTGSLGSGIIIASVVDLKEYYLATNLAPNCKPWVTLKVQWIYQNYGSCSIQQDAKPDWPTFMFKDSYGDYKLNQPERDPLILQKTYTLGLVDWVDLHPWKFEIKKNLNDVTCVILYNYEIKVDSKCL